MFLNINKFMFDVSYYDNKKKLKPKLMKFESLEIIYITPKNNFGAFLVTGLKKNVLSKK
jgi:hypothetical protein